MNIEHVTYDLLKRYYDLTFGSTEDFKLLLKLIIILKSKDPSSLLFSKTEDEFSGGFDKLNVTIPNIKAVVGDWHLKSILMNMMKTTPKDEATFKTFEHLLDILEDYNPDRKEEQEKLIKKRKRVDEEQEKLIKKRKRVDSGKKRRKSKKRSKSKKRISKKRSKSKKRISKKRRSRKRKV